MTGRPGWVTWAGLAVVLVAAAVLSFSALAELAVAVRIPRPLAPLLPVCTDAGVGVATAVWLSGRHHPDARRFARRLTWSLLALTVAGNAAHQGLAAAGVAPPWWAAVVVGAIPPGVVGAVVHLAVLVGRSAPNASNEAPALDPPPEMQVIPAPELRPAPLPVPSPGPPVSPPAGEDRVTALIEAGAGRRKLARELEISEHEAREILARARNGTS